MGKVRIVKASAGSGKTYRLAYEYVREVVEEPERYRHILAVTFTNKATEEMKERIVKEIDRLAAGRASPYMNDLQRDLNFAPEVVRARAAVARTRILHDYSRFAVLTIDKFFQRIIRSFIKELGIDLHFNLELQGDSLLSRAADGVIDHIATDEELKRWIAEFVEEKIAEGRRWDVKTELVGLGKELFRERYKSLVRDEAESAAKARERLSAIVADAQRRAREAKEEMRSPASEALGVIAGAGLQAEDFSGGSRSFALWFVKIAAGEITAPGVAVRGAAESDEKWAAKNSPHRHTILDLLPRLRPLLERLIELYDDNEKLLNSAALLRENYRNFALLTDLSEKIAEICTHENILPISETNHILHRLVSGNDTPFIYEKSGNYFSHFMIDEFQDTSSLQWENFVPLLENAVAQSAGSSVLLVGDVKQSIYRWRGGDWRILAGQIAGRFSEVICDTLSVNYRSLRTVVEFNNRMVEGCVRIDNAHLDAMLERAAAGGFIAPATRDRLHGMLDAAYWEHAQRPKSREWKGCVSITQYPKTDDTGAEVLPPVVARIEELQSRGFAPGEIAILVRYNDEGARIAKMLLDHKACHSDSPYRYDVVTAEALTIGSASVSGFIIACLRLAINPEDASRRAIYNCRLERPFDAEPDAAEGAFLRSLRSLPPEDAFEKILIHYRLSDSPEDIAYIQALHEQVIAFASSTIADIPLFLQWWEEKGAEESIHIPQNASAITIITIHKAKGLQYKAVLIPYCNWELNPRPRTILWADGSRTPFEGLQHIPVGFKGVLGESYFAEEYFDEMVLAHVDALNMFYVAATRAEEELHIMMSKEQGSASRIGKLLLDSIAVSEGTATLPGREDTSDEDAAAPMKGEAKETPAGFEISFGTPVMRRQAEKGEDSSCSLLPANHYPARDPSESMRLRMPNRRYAEEEVPALTPRNYGILMHRLFEDAETPEDVAAALDTMRRNGVVSAAEAARLQQTLAHAFANETVRSWFSDAWETVRNENEIIVPEADAVSASVRRPDRVMIRDRQAVVVDYKFGLARPASHARQLRDYMRLLHSMGYETVKGYLWYVSLDDVETVELE